MDVNSQTCVYEWFGVNFYLSNAPPSSLDNYQQVAQIR
jgi:hypothetical protein